MKPVVAIYSTFLQRAYDQLIHDVALQNLPVVFAIDRAGVVGADGATHIGAFDLSYLRCLPNMTVMAPSDENECRQMLYTGVHARHAGRGALSARRRPGRRHRGRDDARCRSARARSGARASAAPHRVAILAFGAMLQPALAAARGARRDGRQHALRQAARRRRSSRKLAREHDALVTVEENVVAGGAGSAVAEALAAAGVAIPLLHLGLARRVRRSRRSRRSCSRDVRPRRGGHRARRRRRASDTRAAGGRRASRPRDAGHDGRSVYNSAP